MIDISLARKNHNINIFGAIKSIPITDIFKHYSVSINKHNKTKCVFHNGDKTPSLTVYPKTNSFYCFSCGVGGTAIDFVSKLFGLTALDAAKKIDSDFNLDLFSDNPTVKYNQESKEKLQERQMIARFEQWEHDYKGHLADKIRLLNRLKELVNPLKCNGKFNDDFVMAINQLQLLEYHWDILFNGEIEEKTALYIKLGGAVIIT